jgi:hypothetical protein
MKKLLFIILLFTGNHICSYGQLTLDHVYLTDSPDRYVNLGPSGLKYVALHYDVPTISYTYFNLYNPDHSLYKSILIPQFPGKYCNKIEYISEALFDTDSLIEFIAEYLAPAPPPNPAIRVCNELGNILLERDSACTPGLNGLLDMGMGSQTIFPDASGTKLIINKSYFSGSGQYTTEIYNLPGQLACLDCNNGFINGIAVQNPFTSEKSTVAYPNPFTDNVRIRYSLPADARHASLQLFDINGNLVKKKDIDRHFNEIIITGAEIKQGAYVYRIVVDDRVIANEKIIKL